jgi:hypothetical protein
MVGGHHGGRSDRESTRILKTGIHVPSNFPQNEPFSAITRSLFDFNNVSFTIMAVWRYSLLLSLLFRISLVLLKGW